MMSNESQYAIKVFLIFLCFVVIVGVALYKYFEIDGNEKCIDVSEYTHEQYLNTTASKIYDTQEQAVEGCYEFVDNMKTAVIVLCVGILAMFGLHLYLIITRGQKQK